MKTNLSPYFESRHGSLRQVHKFLLVLFLLSFSTALTLMLFQRNTELWSELVVLCIATIYTVTASSKLIAAAKEERKRYQKVVRISIAALLILILSGAVMNVFYRAALGALVYFAACLLGRQLHVSWLSLFLMLLAPPVLVFDTGIPDVAFRPIALVAPLGFCLAIIVDYSRRRWLVSMLAVGLIAFLALVCYPNYWNYVAKQPIPAGNRLAQNKFISSSRDTLDVRALPQKVVLLDLWYSGCAICFQKMPETQKLYERYKNDPNVFIAAVNVFMERDSDDDAWTLLEDYSLPKFKSLDDLKANPWGVAGYPSAIVFDKDRKVRYIGQLEFNPVVRDNVYALVERLKQE